MTFDHRPNVVLTSEPHLHPAVFATAFNGGDPDDVEAVYEPEGVLVAEPGRPVAGAERVEVNASFMALGLPIEVRPRHVYVTGDIALLIVDWSINGTSSSGEAVDISGTATDVARRGHDGRWRYVIDNPFGTA
jgi:ketosteroid isomerase-like protein